MIFKKTKGEYEVILDNHHLAGHIVWNVLWKEWQFVSKRGCILSFPYVKDLYKFMRKIK